MPENVDEAVAEQAISGVTQAMIDQMNQALAFGNEKYRRQWLGETDEG